MCLKYFVYLCNGKLKTKKSNDGIITQGEESTILYPLITIHLLLYRQHRLPFFQFVIDNSNEGPVGVVWLIASLVIIMLVLNFMMTYLAMFYMRIVGRIVLAILSIINATAVYFILTYSVFIDATTIENVFNTRYSEASGFFSWGLWLFILVFGVLPALFCLFQPESSASIAVVRWPLYLSSDC